MFCLELQISATKGFSTNVVQGRCHKENSKS